MKNIKMIRMILLFASIGIVVIGLILSVVSSMKVNDYRTELKSALTAANPNAEIKDLNTSGATILGTIFSAALALFFYIFALIYFFNKSPKVQGRKWPYITMIVLGSLGLLLKLVSYVAIYNKSQPTPLSGSIDTESNRLIVEYIWSSYKSSIVLMIIFGLILSTFVIACHIAQLVFIKKSRDYSDIQYSEQIKNFQQKQNDLP